MSVRVNALDTPWGVRDLIEVATRCPRLDMVILPKVGNAFDVQFADALLGALEIETGRAPIGIEALIETSLGLANVETIAASTPRLEALVFGVGDYSIEMGTCGQKIGAWDTRYAVESRGAAGDAPQRHLNDQWHFALARIANASRANGLRAIDGPYADFRDHAAFINSAERAAALGFEGKWVIHIDQIENANSVFTPPAAQVEWAISILAAIEDANRNGAGAFSRDGVLIDMAVEKIARQIVARSREIQGF